MTFLKTLLQVLYTIYAAILFVAILLIITPFVIVASFFGKIKGGNAIYKLCYWWATTWMLLIGIRIHIRHEAPHNRQQQYIFVSNHISYMDVPMFVATILQPIRVLGKAELAKIPVFGFLYKNTVVMVNRNNAADRAKSIYTLKRVIAKGISVVICPEGTFNETGQPLKAFYDGAFRIAIETQTPIKPFVLPDTVRRMHYRSFFANSPGVCRAIFLEAVPVAGLTLKDVEQLKQIVYNKMEAALIKYDYGK